MHDRPLPTALRTLPKAIEASVYNHVRLALRRLGSPLRVAVPGHRGLEIIFESRVWMCVDANAEDQPVMTWLDFGNRGRDNLQAPVSCILELLQGVLSGAEACRAPVILNFVVPQFKYYDFEMLMAAAVAGAQRSPVPVAIHLDHAADLTGVVQGIRHGCNGVMFDGSHLPFEENVKLTRAVVEVAHGCGIPVEGEIGER